MAVRFDVNGKAYIVGRPMLDPVGVIPHPLQQYVSPYRNKLNPNDVSGARVVGPIMVPSADFDLIYNQPKRGR